MKKLLISTIFILLSSSSIFCQNCEWAEKIGGVGLDFVFSMAVDELGNVFVTGYFYSDTLVSQNEKLFNRNSSCDIFLAKYNINGDCEWFQKIAGSDDEVARYIITDINGNVYVGGEFYSDTLYFNNGILLTNSSNADAFIAKYDNHGTCQWAEKIGGNNDDYNNGIALDSNSNVYVVGQYNSDTLRFNNGKSLNNSGIDDGFIAKYNDKGLCQWVEKFAGNDIDEANSVAIDRIGNIYVAGYYYSDTLYFNNEKYLTNNGNKNIFLAKYDESGLCQWTEKISNCGGFNNYIKIKVNDYLYISGSFHSNNMEFNNSKSLVSLNGVESEVFVAQYNVNGLCQWAEKIGGKKQALAYDISVDKSNNVYIVGEYEPNSLNFNNDISLPTSNKSDAYFAKYSSNGICQWAEKIGGLEYDAAYSIAFDFNDNIYLTGNYSSSSILLNNNKSLLLNDYYDVFIAKYSQNNTSISNNIIPDCKSVSPNPAGDFIEINLDSINPTVNRRVDMGFDIQIFDMLGVNVINFKPAPTISEDVVVRIDVTFLTPGIYFIKIGNRVEKFVKM